MKLLRKLCRCGGSACVMGIERFLGASIFVQLIATAQGDVPQGVWD